MLKDKQMRSDMILARIGDLVRKRADSYKNSALAKGLALRTARTDAMMAMQHYKGEYRGRYGAYLPIFKNNVEMWQAAIRTNLDNDPFITVIPEPGTVKEIVDSNQIVVNWNVRETEHKQDFWMSTDDLAKTGTGFVKHQYMVLPKVYPEAVETELGRMEMQHVEQGVGNDYTLRIHPCNYIQDTTATTDSFHRGKCQYVGEFNKLRISDLRALLKNPNVIKKNVEEEIKMLKDSTQDGSDYYTDVTPGSGEADREKSGVYIEMYGRLPVQDNEDDSRFWGVVVSERSKKVLAVWQVYFHPYSRLFGRQRGNSYLGIGPCEGIASMNLQANLIHEHGLQNLIHNMKRYVVALKDSGITSQMLNETANNGLITLDSRAAGVQQVSQAVQEFSGKAMNLDEINTYMGIINDYVQRESHTSDLLDHGMRASVGKSLTQAGSSATAANIMDQRKKMPVQAFMNQIAIGQEDHWQKKIRSLQMNLPDYLGREILGQDPSSFRKFMMLGRVKGHVSSGYKTNKMLDLQNLTNLYGFLTQIFPLAAQAGQNIMVDFQELARSAMELGDMPNRDKIFAPANQPPAAPPAEAALGGEAAAGARQTQEPIPQEAMNV